MNIRQHKASAKALIAACGGLDEASGACRVGRSSLSNYENVNESATMPADVIADLEAYCGEAVYSTRLASAADRPMASLDIQADAMKLTEIGARMTRQIHEYMADHQLDESERRALSPTLTTLRELLERLDGAVTAPVLREVS